MGSKRKREKEKQGTSNKMQDKTKKIMKVSEQKTNKWRATRKKYFE